MSIFKRPIPPDKNGDYRKALIKGLSAIPRNLDLDLDLETELENEMKDFRQTPSDTQQTIPAGLIDSHLRQIKDLSGQADEFEIEAKRLLKLAKEHRLGVKALEAANAVLQVEEQYPTGLRGTTAVDDKTTSFSLPAATGLSEARK